MRGSSGRNYRKGNEKYTNSRENPVSEMKYNSEQKLTSNKNYHMSTGRQIFMRASATCSNTHYRPNWRKIDGFGKNLACQRSFDDRRMVNKLPQSIGLQ